MPKSKDKQRIKVPETSVYVETLQMGRASVKVMKDLLDDDEAGTYKVTFPTKLVYRESCSKA